jgi:hypothetical protein
MEGGGGEVAQSRDGDTTDATGGAETQRLASLGPFELIKHLPEEAFAASDRRRWVGLEAVRYRDQPRTG